MKSKRLIYITGVPGTGKSAIVQVLNRRGIHAFDMDAVEGLCYWARKETPKQAEDYHPGNEWLQSHDWFCDVEKLKSILQDTPGVIVAAGISANQSDYLKLFDRVFLLQCDPETIVERLERRQKEGTNNFGAHQHEKEFVLKMNEDYHVWLTDQGAIPIDANRPLFVVADDIISKIEK